MLKFTDPHPEQAVLGLNGWSVPYKFGYLNLQVGKKKHPSSSVESCDAAADAY